MVGAVAPRSALFAGDPLWVPTWVEGRGEATLKERMARPVDGAALTLYSSWFCPFAQRAWIACEEKGVDYRWVEINPYVVDPSEPGGYTKKQLPLDEKRAMYPSFVVASPKGLVPAVECGGDLLAESQPIIEYIDGKFSSADPLCPADPYERAKCRIWADYADSKIQRPYYRMLVEQSPEARRVAYEDLLAGCRDFARAMAPASDGPFFCGKRLSYTDVSFAPFFQRIVSVGKVYRGIELPRDDPDIQRLLLWWDAVKARDSVARTIVSTDRLVASYANYADNKATSDFAQNLMSSLSSTTRASSALAGVTKQQFSLLLPVALAAFAAGVAVGARGRSLF